MTSLYLSLSPQTSNASSPSSAHLLSQMMSLLCFRWENRSHGKERLAWMLGFSTIPPAAADKLLASSLKPSPPLVWEISSLLPTQKHYFNNCFLSPLHLQFPSLTHSHWHTKMLDLKIKPSLDPTFPLATITHLCLPLLQNFCKRWLHSVSDPTLPILSWMHSYQAFLSNTPLKQLS